MQLTTVKKRRGFTLTELAIVLGVMGSILSAIWVASARVSASNKAQKATGQIQMIAAGYKSIYALRRVDVPATASAPGTTSDITCMGVNAGIFPADMLPAAACTTGTLSTYPRAPWSGGIVFVYGDTGNNAVRIGYYGLPQSACIALASAQANAPNVLYSYVGTAWTAPHYLAYPPLGGAATMTMTTINVDCADSATSDEVTFGYSMN